MGYKFRTPGPWGAGSPGDLDPADIDFNFWQAIQDIAAKAAQGVGISNITQSGNQLTFVLTDHTLLGPYTLPVVLPKFKGEWLPNTNYLAGDIFTHAGSTYGVNYNHLSDATFDPGKNDGHGNDAYTLLLQNPALTIPAGGVVGQFLRKAGIGDHVTAWMYAGLSDLSDVSIPQSPGPSEGDVLAYSSGIWIPSQLVQPINSLAGLSDVLHSPAPASGDLVYWNGSAFSYLHQSSLSVPVSIATMSDVSYTTVPPNNDDALTYNSATGKWTNLPKQPYQLSSSTSKTLGLPDSSNFIGSSTSTTATITVPLQSTVAFPAGTKFWFKQLGNGIVSIVGAGGVSVVAPTGRLAQTRHNGSVIMLHLINPASNIWHVEGDLAQSAPAIISTSVDVVGNDAEVRTLVPSGNVTFTLSTVAPVGQRLFFIFTTSGTTSYTMSWTTNFKSQGNLVTGTVSGVVFVVSFVGDGTNMNEVSRTTAM